MRWLVSEEPNRKLRKGRSSYLSRDSLMRHTASNFFKYVLVSSGRRHVHPSVQALRDLDPPGATIVRRSQVLAHRLYVSAYGAEIVFRQVAEVRIEQQERRLCRVCVVAEPETKFLSSPASRYFLRIIS